MTFNDRCLFFLGCHKHPVHEHPVHIFNSSMSQSNQCYILAQVKAPTGQEYSEEEIQCHVHFALYPSSSREPHLGDKRQRMRDE